MTVVAVYQAVLEGDAQSAKTLVQASLDAGIPAGEILNNGCIAAMAEVGQLFEEGEMFVPEMLIAARAMQAGMDILKPHLAEGEFTESLVRLRADYMFTPRAFLGALVQYNSSNDSLTSNIRFRWEYQPGSDIFVVYSDGRDTSTFSRWYPQLENRSLVFKFTRLFRF